MGALFLSAFNPASPAYADDRQDILTAAEAYFQAEISGDTERVWSMIAPSSQFKRMYSKEDYSALVGENPVRVKSYAIEEIIEIMDNSDRKSMPTVDKIALVQVRVVLAEGGARDTEHRSIFTFLRENGQWFKG